MKDTEGTVLIDEITTECAPCDRACLRHQGYITEQAARLIHFLSPSERQKQEGTALRNTGELETARSHILTLDAVG